ncbi:MAG: LLM class flavin-dependent oxidoreductase [Pseudonocardiaceae bacterium]
MLVRDFRFSFNVRGIESRDAFVEKCRMAERQGYDTVFAADHLGSPAPFPLLVAAAAATQRLRVGTLVLNAAFWNPALLEGGGNDRHSHRRAAGDRSRRRPHEVGVRRGGDRVGTVRDAR